MKMKNNSGFAVIAAIIVIVIVGIAGTMYFVITDKQKHNSLPPMTQANTDNPQSATNDMPTYKGTRYYLKNPDLQCKKAENNQFKTCTGTIESACTNSKFSGCSPRKSTITTSTKLIHEGKEQNIDLIYELVNKGELVGIEFDSNTEENIIRKIIF